MRLLSSSFSRWLLLALLVLAFTLRLYKLNAQSLWYDEAVTAQVVQQGLPELARWTADDIQPPLYYVVLSAWTRLAGVSEWALRFPSAWFGLLMVVLGYAMGRRLFGRIAGLFTALLATTHPLWVYYSQEARMYTLLSALGMLAGYALLRVGASARHRQIGSSPDNQTAYANNKMRAWWWLIFALAGVAMLYTHYFAAFLLLAFGVYFVGALLAGWLQPRGRLLREGALVAAAIIIAYLPWLPNALRRFGEDASYWRGTLKLNEALRHLAISFSVGETMLEQQATPVAWAVVGLAAICALALLWSIWSKRGNKGKVPPTLGSGDFSRPAGHGTAEAVTTKSSVVFVLLYLLVPIASILLLSYSNPKFNPRYLMLASPAFVLLLAGGLALPFSLTINRSPLTINHFLRLLSLLSLLSLLTLSAASLRNWFADPAFTKDDWRGAVAYVQSQLQSDEAVVLVSGHAYPAWRYYAPDIEPVRLPAIETLDVHAVLDMSVAEQMNTALAGKRGAWLVQWQADVVDPNGVTPFLLDTAGDAQPSTASFWGLGTPQHYRFFDAVRTTPDAPGAAFPTELPLTAAYQGQQLNVNFGNQVELVGYSQPPCDEPLCPVYLFWRPLQPLAADLKLSAVLFDRYTDVIWSQPLDRRLAAYNYPTFRWRPGEVVLSKLEVPADQGTPPGEYRLRLGVYDAATGQALDVLDVAGAAQGRWAWLEPVVAQALVVDGPNGPPAGSATLQVAPEITLLALAGDRSAVEPGDPVRIDAWWQAAENPGRNYAVGWQWIDPTGQAHPGGGWTAPTEPTFPTTQWPTGATVRGQFDIFPPYDAQPGNWQLRIGLIDARAERGDAPFAGAAAELPITVLPSTRRFEPSAPFDVPAAANFAFLIELLGVRLDDGGAMRQPGDTVTATVGWRALQRMDTSYTGFVHLLDEAGRIVAQDDHVPLAGRRPTTTWAAGEVVEDPFTLALPPDLPPGRYRLEIGLYDAGRPGLPRLRTSEGADSVLLGEITLSE